MRTTLEIEDDIYLYARQVALAEQVSVGKVVTRLMREGARVAGQVSAKTSVPDPDGYVYRNGIPIIPGDGRVITQDLIDRIRDEEGI